MQANLYTKSKRGTCITKCPSVRSKDCMNFDSLGTRELSMTKCAYYRSIRKAGKVRKSRLKLGCEFRTGTDNLYELVWEINE